MPLLKHRDAVHAVRSAVVLDLGDLSRQADRILAEAHREAGEIVARGRDEAEALIAGADARGFEQGMERGLREGREAGGAEGREAALQEYRQRLDLLAESWSQALDDWECQRQAMVLDAREDVLAFAFALAEKIVGRAIELRPELVQAQVGEALSLLSRPSAVTIAVHPEDRALVEEVLAVLPQRLSQCEHAALADDASISRGGCVVRTAGGQIDATIETQVARLAEALLPRGSGPPGADGEEREA